MCFSRSSDSLGAAGVFRLPNETRCMVRLLRVVLILLVATACLAKLAVPAEIRQNYVAISKAWESKDARAILSHFTDDLKLIKADGTTQSLTEVKQALAGLDKLPAIKQQIEILECVSCDEQQAVLKIRQQRSVGAKSQTVVRVDTWVRHDGRWRCSRQKLQ